MQQEKKVLLGMSLDELKAVVKALGMPQFTAGQIAKWLYQQHVTQIDEMTNISKANREKLSGQFIVGAMQHIDCQRSVDGTLKYLFPVGDGSKFVETFLLAMAQNSSRQSISPMAIVPRFVCLVRWAVR